MKFKEAFTLGDGLNLHPEPTSATFCAFSVPAGARRLFIPGAQVALSMRLALPPVSSRPAPAYLPVFVLWHCSLCFQALYCTRGPSSCCLILLLALILEPRNPFGVPCSVPVITFSLC